MRRVVFCISKGYEAAGQARLTGVTLKEISTVVVQLYVKQWVVGSTPTFQMIIVKCKVLVGYHA